MAQYQIPQFIETENKIVGPLTLRQFMYCAAGGAASAFFYFIGLNLFLWFLVTAFIAVIVVPLAFLKYNSQPLSRMMFLAFGFLWRPRFYVWKREIEERVIEVPAFPTLPALPPLRESALRGRTNWRETLSSMPEKMPSVNKLWQDLMTTKEPIPTREKAPRTPHWGRKPKEQFEVFRKITGEREVARRIDYR